MGTDQEWANDAPKGKGWCPLLAAGLLSGVVVSAWGLWVLTVDVVKLLS